METPEADAPESAASLERRLEALDDGAQRAGTELERIESERGAALARSAALQAGLAEIHRRIARGRAAQEQAVRERADLERRYADLLEREQVSRSRYERAEQRVESFRAVETFARLARASAEASGNAERAGREHDAEERASREREEAEIRLADLRAIASGVTAERSDVERHVLAEREVESDVSTDRVAAELEREASVAEIARVAHEADTLEADAAAVRDDLGRIDRERMLVRDALGIARERLIGETSSRIEALRAAEERKRLERMAAERIVAAMRAEEEHLARERVALERAERERLERKRALERREAYDRALDERLERKRREADDGDDPVVPDDRIPSIFDLPVIAPQMPSVAASASAPHHDDAHALGSFFGRFGRRRRDAPSASEPHVDVASRIARDFGLLGDGAPPSTETGPEPKP